MQTNLKFLLTLILIFTCLLLAGADRNNHTIIPAMTAPITKQTSLLNNVLREQLRQKQLALFQLSEKSAWGGVSELKYLDTASIEYAMTLAAEGNTLAQKWADETLDSNYMLLDPIWGGIYSYSSHGDWHHPNYEKPLAVQAENLRLYTEAYKYWYNPAYLLAAQKIADYIKNFLTSPEGVFYSGQSAYMVAGKQDAAYYQLDDKQRRKLGIPPIDKHIYTDANGLAINALIYFYLTTNNIDNLKLAEKALNWIIKNNSTGTGGFYHTNADKSGYYLSDNLAMSRALLTFYKATTDIKYLLQAEQAMNFINAQLQNTRDKVGFIEYIPVNKATPVKIELNAENNEMLTRVATLLYHYTGNKTYYDMANTAMRYLVTPEVIAHYPQRWYLCRI